MIRPLPEDYILNGFLEQGVGRGACSVRSTHRPGIAVPLGTVHSFLCLKTGFIPKKRSLFQEQRTFAPPPPPPPDCRVMWCARGAGPSFFVKKKDFFPKNARPSKRRKLFPPPPPPLCV